MIARPRTQPVKAWRYEDYATAPAWVKHCCLLRNGQLIHERRSGRQVLNLGEWLVEDFDGGVTFRTPEEFEREFTRKEN